MIQHCYLIRNTYSDFANSPNIAFQQQQQKTQLWGFLVCFCFWMEGMLWGSKIQIASTFHRIHLWTSSKDWISNKSLWCSTKVQASAVPSPPKSNISPGGKILPWAFCLSLRGSGYYAIPYHIMSDIIPVFFRVLSASYWPVLLTQFLHVVNKYLY